MIAQILLAWLKLLALDGDLAKAEPKTLRYRVLHAAARLVRGGRRRRMKIHANWPWAEAITGRLAADLRAPASPLTSTDPSLRSRKETPGPVEPPAPGPPAGPPSYPDAKITAQTGPADTQRQPSTPMKDQG